LAAIRSERIHYAEQPTEAAESDEMLLTLAEISTAFTIYGAGLQVAASPTAWLAKLGESGASFHSRPALNLIGFDIQVLAPPRDSASWDIHLHLHLQTIDFDFARHSNNLFSTSQQGGSLCSQSLHSAFPTRIMQGRRYPMHVHCMHSRFCASDMR
jgi:hypothetical protein